MTEETLFELARKTPEAERTALLDRACEGMPELRARVEALLQADAGSSPFSNPSPTIDATTGFRGTASYNSSDPVPGIVIAGRYTLEQMLGEGGMGEVWVAKQSEPVKRKVALKLIKAGMDSKSVVQRFEQERQALALMDHPNIAKVLDGGITEQRQPFFVMELVNGLPLNKFCDEAKLSIQERLELFVLICQAVQHAHQKGIVHRDLKPGNILVTMIDGKPVPKVIDFGVAKATGGKLTDESMSTQFGAVVGTLEYMSPEQAGFSNQDVDTRADIYSLGVILYELLTGLRPFDSKRLKQAALDEVIRIIREEEPSKPSTKLSTDESLPSLAAVRHIEPGKLTALLRGELDWVVMKCLEKQRDRRYESANGLARDIQRYLADELVEAKPPSAGYRLRKLYTRNKGKVIAAGLVLLALVLGVVGTSLGLYQANLARDAEARQREIAEAKQREANEERAKAQAAAEREKERADGEQRAKNEALRNLEFAKKGNTILGAVFAGLNPNANYATVGEFSEALKKNLKKATSELDGNAIGDPLEVAAMQHTLGLSLLGLRESNLAIDMFGKSFSTRKELLGAEHPDTISSLHMLANGYQGAGRFREALPLLEESLKLVKAKQGPDHLHTLIAMSNLARGYQSAGRIREALPILEESYKLHKARLGPDHPSTISIMGSLANGYLAAERLSEALQLSKESFKLCKAKLGPDHPMTLTTMNDLASIYESSGRLAEALKINDETFKVSKAKLGRSHPSTLTSMNNLALSYQSAGRMAEALQLFEESFNLCKANLEPDHPETLLSMYNLAVGYRTAGKLDMALPLNEETLRLMKAKLGSEHPNTLMCMNSLAVCHWSLKQLDRSVPIFQELLPLYEKNLGRLHQKTLNTLGNLGVNYKDAGNLTEAIPLLEEVYQSSQNNSALKWIGFHLLEAYLKSGKSAETAKLINEMLADSRKSLPKDSSQLAGQLFQFGMSYREIKQFSDAESLLRECLVIREKSQPDAWNTFSTQSLLGGTLLSQKKYADAEPLLVKGYEGMKSREKSIPQQAKFRIPEALDRLIQLYTETNKPDEVKKWQAEKAKLTGPSKNPSTSSGK